ncbi:MAG TPA: formylglycine-generating enzyme family protein [Steroidobacteraceae bacterium]|jgi:formylglycine-generating enzyme required for sulfatase activity
MRKVFVLALLACVVNPPSPTLAAEPRDVAMPGGTFASVLPPSAKTRTTKVAPFRLDRTLVSNADYASFLRTHPEWQRGNVPKLFADSEYLSAWKSAADPGDALARKPVTQVSWFAASAYCEAQGKRLPRWYEWELAAAASDRVPDARADATWRQKILDWYAKSANGPLPDVGASPPNYYGVRDLHGVAWEWVEDAGGMLVSDDGREQGDGSRRFCGAGATSFEQKENYAMLMRIAMLSSMKASYTASSMSFRCAADVEKK